jgi:hypothetical protein
MRLITSDLPQHSDADHAASAVLGIVRKFRQLMPSEAMGLSRIQAALGIASQHILSMRHGFQMCWIDTSRRAAQMVQFEMGKDGSTSHFVADAVNKEESFASSSLCDDPVTGLTQTAGPQPAACLGYLNFPVHAFRNRLDGSHGYVRT